MEKVKVRKSLPKQKNYKRKVSFTPKKTTTPPNKFADDYLKFYDDIKVPSKRYDW